MEIFYYSLNLLRTYKTKDISDVILETEVKKLFIAPSRLHLDKVEQRLAPEMFREAFLSKAIQKLGYYFIINVAKKTVSLVTKPCN